MDKKDDLVRQLRGQFLELAGLAMRAKREAIKWRRVALVAVVACPGSFVAGGFMLQEVAQTMLGWWQ